MKEFVRESRSRTELFDRLARWKKEQVGATYFLEKSPRHALRMKYITSHYPNASIIFVVRDPRDAVHSARKHPVIWSNFDDTDRLGDYLDIWRRSVCNLLQYERNSSVILLRYEDFCQSPKKNLSDIMKQIGIDLEEHQLNPDYYGDTKDSDPETHRRLKAPITPRSVGNWKAALGEKEVQRIEHTLGDLMQDMGYSLTTHAAHEYSA